MDEQTRERIRRVLAILVSDVGAVTVGDASETQAALAEAKALLREVLQ